MENLKDLGRKTLIHFGDFELTLAQTIILLTAVFLLLFFSSISTYFLRKSKLLSSFGTRLKKLLVRSVNYFIWIFGLIYILRFQNVDTQSFFLCDFRW